MWIFWMSYYVFNKQIPHIQLKHEWTLSLANIKKSLNCEAPFSNTAPSLLQLFHYRNTFYKVPDTSITFSRKPCCEIWNLPWRNIISLASSSWHLHLHSTEWNCLPCLRFHSNTSSLTGQSSTFRHSTSPPLTGTTLSLHRFPSIW